MSEYLTFQSALIPFIEHDDPTRCQMADSQMRQSLILENPDSPLISTGYENVEHIEYYMFKAKHDGKVLFKNNKIVILKYDDDNLDNTIDFFVLTFEYKCYFEKNDTFKRGDIIAEHRTMTNGNLKFGKNLLACYTELYGYLHEDSIIMSRSCANKYTSIHKGTLDLEIHPDTVLISLSDNPNEYQPLPLLGSVIKAGDPIIKTKLLTNSPKHLFQEPTIHTLPYDIEIYDIHIFPNKWNTNYSDYDRYIRSLKKNSKYVENQINKLSGQLKESDIQYINHIIGAFIHKSNLLDKGLKFPSVKLKIEYIYKKYVQPGDKFANRHGNKGVISKILPDEEMPKTEDGRVIDIIFGNLSIISRMNVGQLFELHTGMAIQTFKDKLLKMYETDPHGAITVLKNFTKDMDTTKDKWFSKHVDEMINKYGDSKKLIEDYVFIQPPFEGMTKSQLDKLLNTCKTKQSYKIKINDKVVGPVALGYIYVLKLNHTVQDKLRVRSTGSYTTKYMTPPKGGAQRVGEMEVWSFMAYDAMSNLKEILIKSDNFGDKIRVYRKLYGTGFNSNLQLVMEPASLTLFKRYFNVIGVSF